ncbi:Pectinesterase [Heracleum sosnowskyi]|uniref:Pectinesterase n=1 Tax=Heracleum sosnowskyi TaxID=360622 RepID=A0AAD8MVT2_9APIA|nr:Pectinesterase [Heracleum sosnowskyi]
MAMNKNIVVVTLSSILLVGLVIAAVVGTVQYKNMITEEAQKTKIAESQKAVESVCKPTQYKDTCVQVLGPAAINTTDPKELIKAGFEYAVQHIRDSINKSETLHAAEKDPRTAGAYIVCQNVLESAIDDLKRSFSQINDFDLNCNHMDEYIFDLKVWLSAASTAQGTCLDAFEKTSGDAGEKMKAMLRISRELTINGYNMIDQLSRELADLQITSTPPTRKLLQFPGPGEFPAWVKGNNKELLKGDKAKHMANVIVAQDGSGKVKTVNEAIKMIPIDNHNMFIVYIKAGEYKEIVRLEKFLSNVMLVGDGPKKTKITGDRSQKKGFHTLDSATVGICGFNIIAKGITFENTAAADEGPAVALHVAADKSIFYNCRFDGNQDTLYTHDYRQFYRECTISGTIDFIFGDSVVVLQSCKIIARKPALGQENMIVAQGREFVDDITGIVIQNCTITAEAQVLADPKIQTYLGRPWKTFSKMVIIDSFIESFVNPLGWQIWEEKKPNNMTAYIVEYGNKGPGADVSKRVKWPSVKTITPAEANNYCPTVFLKGDDWIPSTGIPYISMASTTFPASSPVTSSAPASSPVTSSAPASSPVTSSAPASSPITSSAPASSPVTSSAPASSPVTSSAPASSPITSSAPASSPVTSSAPASSPITSSAPASSPVNRSSITTV